MQGGAVTDFWEHFMRLLALSMTLLGVLGFGTLALQAQGNDASKKEEPKKETPKEEPKKDAPKEEWLDDAAYEKLMEECKDNWNKLKINAKSKMGDKAAEAADKLAEAADKMLKHHLKEMREAKDYKDWVAELKKAAQDFSKAAKKSDWKEADKQKEKLATSCSDDGCHGKYRKDE
ncbi:MAG: hypothetical protein DPW14_16435 [Planctomycetes bacterium]|nr:hypothetical protein [Planctomycetota bacterium]